MAAFSNGTADDLLFAVLLTANYWLIIGFAVHLIMRSVWVAFVGLSYVYKDGVDLQSLNFKDRYNKVLEGGWDYTQSILKLEKVCSTVFAASFLIFMCTIGAFFFLSKAACCNLKVASLLSNFTLLTFDFLLPPLQHFVLKF